MCSTAESAYTAYTGNEANIMVGYNILGTNACRVHHCKCREIPPQVTTKCPAIRRSKYVPMFFDVS